jgi:hypothetical protein
MKLQVERRMALAMTSVELAAMPSAASHGETKPNPASGIVNAL